MRKHFIDASFSLSHHATFHNRAKRDQVRVESKKGLPTMGLARRLHLGDRTLQPSR